MKTIWKEFMDFCNTVYSITRNGILTGMVSILPRKAKYICLCELVEELTNKPRTAHVRTLLLRAYHVLWIGEPLSRKKVKDREPNRQEDEKSEQKAVNSHDLD